MKIYALTFFAVAVSAIGISGCGGSSSAENEPATQQPPQISQASLPTYNPGSISEDNAESLVKSTYSHLRYIAWDHVPEQDLQQEFSPDQLVGEFTETDTFDLSAFMCPDSGTYIITVAQGPLDRDAEDDLFASPGDKITFTFENCTGEQTTLPGDTREGTSTIEVLEGYLGVFGEKSSTSRSVRRVAVGDGYLTEEGVLRGYTDGDMVTEQNGQQKKVISGVEYRQNPDNQISLEYYLGDYSLALEITDYSGFYDRWKFWSNGDFDFGINSLGGYFNTNLQDLIYTNGRLESGVITLTDDSTTLRIELFDSHLTYKLDRDGDGVYEIDRMLDRSEF